MDAGKATISGVFNGSRLLEIPFYQRAYVEEADGERRVYFVTETKGGKNGEPALRDAEKIKIGCAKKHFEALDLGNDFHYNVRTTYQYEAVKA